MPTIQLFTYGPNTSESHIEYINIRDKRNASGDIVPHLEIRELVMGPTGQQTVVHDFALSQSQYVVFDTAVTGTGDITYTWTDVQDSMSSAQAKLLYRWKALSNTSMDFIRIASPEGLTLQIIGTDDIRIGVVRMAPHLGAGTKIGFRLAEPASDDWLEIACDMPLV